jgi:hypothetical protein
MYLRVGRVGERPFWADEAWVANAATQLGYGALLRQTDLPMPPVFAASVKFLGNLVSPAELGMRLPAILCGIACVPLCYLIARTLRVPQTVALAAMSLGASGHMLVRWSREVKQYQIEAFLSLLLAWLVFRIRSQPAGRVRWLEWSGVILACLVGPWIGYGTVFPATVLLGILIVFCRGANDRRESLIVGLAGMAVLAVSTGAVLQLVAAAQGSHPALIEFTASRWLIDPRVAMDWLWAAYYTCASTAVVLFPADWELGMPMVERAMWFGLIAAGVWAVAVIGVWSWPGRGRREMVCWLIGPWVLLLIAGVAQRYPFAQPRMMAFCAGPITIAFAAGLVRIVRGCSLVVLKRGGPGMLLGAALTLVPAVYMINVPMRHSYSTYHDFPTVIDVLKREHSAGELVVVTHMAAPSVRYYVDESIGPIAYMVNQAGSLADPGRDEDAWATDAIQRAGRRWWVLTLSMWPDAGFDKLQQQAERKGYEMHIVADAEGAALNGVPQLIRVTRPGRY